jgi:ABC-2 type transport system ATP-binding protein
MTDSSLLLSFSPSPTLMSTEIPIRIESLSHHYGQRQALAGVSFDVPAGEIFALLGPNGGGKTTLFRILCTAMQPTGGAGDAPGSKGGRASICGHDVVTEAAAVRRAIGVVFQHPSLDNKLTVRENLRHHGRLYGLSGAELEARIDEMLARFRLTDRGRDLVENLSGGLARRADLAKGLLHRPRVLLLDEPSTGLDPQARWELWQFLDASRRQDGLTLLMTTHFMDEADRCDRVGIIDGGHLVAVGPPSELKKAIAGECLHLQTDDVPALVAGIRERLGLSPTVVGQTVRLEHEHAHELIPILVKAFPERIKSVSLSMPTLEEVFIHHTGRRFEEQSA